MKAVEFMNKPYRVIKANSGGIIFSIDDARPQFFRLHLLKKQCPHELAYTITISESSTLFDANKKERIHFKIPNFYSQNRHEFFLTWFNDVICLRNTNEKQPSLIYTDSKVNTDKEIIGFIQFVTSKDIVRPIEWTLQSSPVIYAPMTVVKQVKGGELRWVSMTSRSELPIDALIGGFENEPLYIARAWHRGSSCPGKFVKSKQIALLPWGHEEVAKNEFEILCGYDAIWVKSSENRIPENAFIGGFSEVNNEPLFIGRGWVHGNLVVGKVHMLYKTCYLPYQGREFEKSVYETLVVGNKIPRGETNHSLCCYMNMVMQPCV